MSLLPFSEEEVPKEELVSMVELCSKFTNRPSANLFLYQFAFAEVHDFRGTYLSLFTEKYKKLYPDIKQMELLNERPGLQRITYSANYDKKNERRISLFTYFNDKKKEG